MNKIYTTERYEILSKEKKNVRKNEGFCSTIVRPSPDSMMIAI